jgi:hypothetical protein
VPVLNRIREIASQDLDIHIEGPSKVSLFAYDNGSFIVESYNPDPVTVKIVVNNSSAKLKDILNNEVLTGNASTGNRIWGRDKTDVSTFEITVKPHSYRVFQTNK